MHHSRESLRRHTLLLSSAAVLAVLSACAHSGSHGDGEGDDRPVALGELLEAQSGDVLAADAFEMNERDEFTGLSPEAQKALSEIVDDTNSRAVTQDDPDRKDEGLGGQFSKIPAELNPAVQKWIQFFVVKDRERFQRFLSRGSSYREVVQEVLRENNVPPELYYLAMIESGYSTHARSHARAVGAWQFMRATGRRYGLEANDYVDERRDPIRATEAAAKYLTDLYNIFQDWYLALSAYNSGEGRVLGAIMRTGTRDYWEIVEKKGLPRETANYVPKFLAAMIIGENPDRFGFEHQLDGEPYPDVKAVELPSPVNLRDVAKISGVSLSDLEKVNPHLRRGITSPRSTSYEIWVPEEKVASVEAIKDQLTSQRLRNLRVADVQESSSERGYVRVRRGENLSALAQRHRVSVAYLKRLNGLGSDRIFAGMRLRVSAREYHRRIASDGGASGGSVTRYRVRRGDNLHSIARRFGVTVSDLKRLNGLRRNVIYVGQRLKVLASSM